MKELIFVHDWIGPNGPTHNSKTLDVYDLAKRSQYIHCDRHSSSDEIDPLAMDLKKHVNCRVVPSYEIDSLKGKPFLYEMQLSQKMGFNIINLASGVGFFNHAPVNQQVLEAVRAGQGYILVTCILESFLEDFVFAQFYDYFAEHNIPLDRVIYLSNCANARELHLDWCHRHNKKPKLNCEYVGLYLINQSGILQDPRFSARSFSVSNYKKKETLFLNLNRRLRLHRYLLLLKMYEMGVLNDFKMSFNKEHTTTEHWLAEVQPFCERFGITLSEGQLRDIYHQLPFVLDTDDFSKFPMEQDIFSTAPLYDKTHISIVSETNFDNNIIHMTEKTIKPILFKQPFIVVGPAHTLKYLRNMGFKTFSDFWDESYDEILDPVERMRKLTDLIYGISQWPTLELEKLYFKAIDIVNYNFELFKEKNTVELNNFVEKYGSTL